MARSPTTSDVFNAIAEVRRREILDALAPLRPLHEWLAKYEQMWNERLDRMDDYLKELQKGENGSDA